MSRLDDLTAFYGLLGVLETRLGRKGKLRDCSGRQEWPRRGVYFFFERGK